MPASSELRDANNTYAVHLLAMFVVAATAFYFAKPQSKAAGRNHPPVKSVQQKPPLALILDGKRGYQLFGFQVNSSRARRS